MPRHPLLLEIEKNMNALLRENPRRGKCSLRGAVGVCLEQYLRNIEGVWCEYNVASDVMEIGHDAVRFAEVQTICNSYGIPARQV